MVWCRTACDEVSIGVNGRRFAWFVVLRGAVGWGGFERGTAMDE